jgi:two-component system invasion response regulator UvrY
MTDKNILLIDDHHVVRRGLIAVLNDFYRNLKFFEAPDDEAALRILKHQDIDLIVLDLQLPGIDTIRLIELILIRYPQIYILIYSMLPEAMYGRRVLKAGASGFLNKEAPFEEVKKAFDIALAGKKYMSPQLVEMLTQSISNRTTSNPFEKLSHREFEIIHFFLKGKSISEISKRLNIKPSTVGTYKSRIFEKLAVSNLFELNHLAALYGLNNLSISYQSGDGSRGI